MGRENYPSVVPVLRYKDAAAAIDWLCEVFGFSRHLVVPGAADSIVHCQLVMPEGGMVILGSAGDSTDYEQAMATPADLGGLNTQAIYVIVEDIVAHYARTTAHKAKIFDSLASREYGGQGYGCFDLEGNLWSFGDYNPHPE